MDMISFTTFYIITMNAILALILVALLKASNKDKDADKRIVVKSITLFSTWLIIEGVLLNASIIPNDISSVGLFILILIFVVISGMLLSPLIPKLVSLSQEFLLLPQAMRMFFGAGFIVEAAYGIIPLNYGVIDGVLHITTAFLASVLAICIAQGYKANKALLAVNLFGLLDIVVVAYGIAFFILKDIGIEHNVFFAVFFAAPIFIWLHLISLYKLYHENKHAKLL